MPTKIDVKKLLREMVDFEQGPKKQQNVYVNRARFEAFREACKPADASPVLDYLMECVIRGSKPVRKKKS